MNKYILIQDAEFDNNPIYILCAPRKSGKTIALMNYIGFNCIPCDYLYMYRRSLDNAVKYIQDEIEEGLIKKTPMLHFVEYKRHGNIKNKNFSRLIIELEQVDIYDFNSIIYKALNVNKYQQIILVGTPDRFKAILQDD